MGWTVRRFENVGVTGPDGRPLNLTPSPRTITSDPYCYGFTLAAGSMLGTYRATFLLRSTIRVVVPFDLIA